MRPDPVCAEELFATRNQNPLLRGFYQPLPSDSRLDSSESWSATLLVSNTLNVESRPHESLLVDGESTAINLAYENGLFRRWRLRLSLPILHDSGGVLDSVIDDWHRLFGFSRGARPFYPKRRIDYSYANSSGAESLSTMNRPASATSRPMSAGMPSRKNGEPCPFGAGSRRLLGQLRI